MLRTGSRTSASSRTRKRREEKKKGGVRAVARTYTGVPSPPATPRTPAESRTGRHRSLRRPVPHSAPREAARCRHARHAARIAAPCPPSRTSRPSCLSCRHVAAFGPRPPTTRKTPTAFQASCRFTESHFRSGFPKIGRVPPLPRFGNRLRQIPGPSQESTLRRRRTDTSPQPAPQRTAVAMPMTGSADRRPP